MRAQSGTAPRCQRTRTKGADRLKNRPPKDRDEAISVPAPRETPKDSSGSPSRGYLPRLCGSPNRSSQTRSSGGGARRDEDEARVVGAHEIRIEGLTVHVPGHGGHGEDRRQVSQGRSDGAFPWLQVFPESGAADWLMLSDLSSIEIGRKWAPRRRDQGASASTGRPRARQSWTPSSRRTARKPSARRTCTASAASTQ